MIWLFVGILISLGFVPLICIIYSACLRWSFEHDKDKPIPPPAYLKGEDIKITVTLEQKALTITNGNCIICGKVLNGASLFLCNDCKKSCKSNQHNEEVMPVQTPDIKDDCFVQ